MPSLLSDNEIAALHGIRAGADVHSYATAMLLRNLDTLHPGLVHITDAMGTYGPKDVHPYFGALLTVAGAAAIGVEPSELARKLAEPAEVSS